MVYLITKPPNWDVYEGDIINHMRDGRSSIRSGLKELIVAGYITMTRKRVSKTGQFDGYDYDVYETPRTNGGVPVFVMSEDGTSGEPWKMSIYEEQKFMRGERGNYDG